MSNKVTGDRNWQKKRLAKKTSTIQKLGTNHKIIENKAGAQGAHEDWGTGTGAQRT